ncbi:MAG: fibrobacter succinogenes major paralogous domain-containing protein, partial [Mariniphaga sp.]
LYNWEKAMELCPEGWRLPSDEDWMELERFLGMKNEELMFEGERGVAENIGGKLKDTGTTWWDPPNMGATNETGFTARPCGHHNLFAWYPDGTFRFYDDYFDEVAFYWTSTSVGDSAYIRYLDDSAYGIFRRKFMKGFGYSVRYVKDN